MFRIIHPNRWFIWTIALTLMIFIVVWGAVERYAIEQEYSYTGDEIYYSVRLHKKSIDISSWKTYRNEKYGFEFKYPVDFTVTTDPIDPESTGEPDLLFKFRVHRVGKGQPGIDERALFNGYEMELYPISKQQDILLRIRMYAERTRQEWKDRELGGRFEKRLLDVGVVKGELYIEEISSLVGPIYGGYVVGGPYVFTISTYNPEDNLKQILGTLTFFEPKR